MTVRVCSSYPKHDGFAENITLGRELGDAGNCSGRIRILWHPSDQIRLNFTAQYFKQNTNGAAGKGTLDPTPGARTMAQDSPSSYEFSSEVYSLIAEWDFESITVKSLSSYQLDDIVITRDNDKTDLGVLGPFVLLPSFLDPQDQRQKT